MPETSAHPDDPHYLGRSNWLRAAVLGANDGIVSVSALVVGVAAANPDRNAILIARVAGLAAGAMSMAVSEYVSVSSQSDMERGDITRELRALDEAPEEEFEELIDICKKRGLTPATARTVATELSGKDALAAHVREELGLTDELGANPLSAALASGFTFSVAAAIPVVAAFLAPASSIISVVLVVTVSALAILGALGAKAGGAPILPAVLWAVSWSVGAMIVTAAIGRLFGVSV